MNSWDERWSHGEHSGSEPSPVLTDAVRDLSPGKALDLGSGAGRNALHLARNGWKVVAADSSTTAIRIAGMRAIELGVELDARVIDLEGSDLPFEPGEFDLILMFYYMQRELFPRIHEWLKPGGTFVAAIHTVDERPGIHHMNPRYLLEPGELRRAFEDFEILSWREGDPRDEMHRRMTAEIVARKPLDR